ncbi:hypothetical protein RFI_38142, partial [Reticulomyxa filosa]
LFVCDVWKNKIHRDLKNSDMIAEINRLNDYIVVYYVPKPLASDDKISASLSNSEQQQQQQQYNTTASTSTNTTNNKNNNNNKNRQQVLSELNFFCSDQYREEYELIVIDTEAASFLSYMLYMATIRYYNGKKRDDIVPLTERSFRFLVSTSANFVFLKVNVSALVSTPLFLKN